MKGSLCALLLLLTFVSAYHRFNYKDESDMLDFLKDEDHHIYVLFFYNGNPKQSKVGALLKDRNDEERKRVQTIILEKYPQVAYSDCEVSTGRFDNVMKALGVERDPLGEWPTIAVVDDGNGRWVHGPNAAPFAERIVFDFTPNNPVPATTAQ